MEPYVPGRRLFPSRYSISPSTTPTPTLTNGSSSSGVFSSPGSSPNNTVTRTIPTTIQINRPYINNSNNNINGNNPATTNSSSTTPAPKRPTNTSLSSLGIGAGNSLRVHLCEFENVFENMENAAYWNPFGTELPIH